jgi:hypothetical protein
MPAKQNFWLKGKSSSQDNDVIQLEVNLLNYSFISKLTNTHILYILFIYLGIQK